MPNIDQEADPAESYVAPPRIFNGKELQSYSDGNKMLLAMITRDGDPDGFFLFALLYVLSEPRAEVQKATANKDQARLDVLKWLDDLRLSHAAEPGFMEDGSPNPLYVPGEFEEAQALALTIMRESNKNKVDPVASAAGGNA